MPRLLIFAAVLVLLAMALQPQNKAEADHPWEAHGYGFHGCEVITFDYASFSANTPNSRLGYFAWVALDWGWGWDAVCGNKFWYQWYPTVFIEVNYPSVVQQACGVSWAWGCAIPYDCIWEQPGWAVCKFWIMLTDWAFNSYPLYMINHEVGHVMGAADHGCGYYGIMNNRCGAGQLAWPTWPEYWAANWRAWNGP